MLDGTVKTVLIDESLPVHNLVSDVCVHIGLSNHEEYSFQVEKAEVAEKKDDGKLKKKASSNPPEKSSEGIHIQLCLTI